MALDRRDLNETSRAPWAIPVVLTVVAIGLGVWRVSVGYRPQIVEPPPDESASAAETPPPPPAPRCMEVSEPPFIIGDAPVVSPSAPPSPAVSMGGVPSSPPASPAADLGEEIDDPTAPFAVEIGRGTVFAGGFAAGARRDAEGGAVAMVATLGADGTGGKLVRLGRSRGDLDAPVVAGAGASVLAVLIEPNASGRTLKVAKVTGADVTWGPELSEGRDESLAVDIAASGARALVVWDDLVGAGEAARSTVMLASLDVGAMRLVAPARPVTVASADAGEPHLITRPGGYWLGYLAHGEVDAKKKHAHDDSGENEDEGEVITTSWVEMVPLDEAGSPAGAARAITPKSGHVLSFDLELGENGNALVAWRDDETPTGSGGGRVSDTLVRLGGGGDPRVLVEEAGGTGAPDLLPGWISLASVNGATRVAAMSPAGELLEALEPEPSLGTGEPIAATREAILWARPLGKAMRLSVVRCQQRAVVGAGVDAGAGDAAR